MQGPIPLPSRGAPAKGTIVQDYLAIRWWWTGLTLPTLWLGGVAARRVDRALTGGVQEMVYVILAVLAALALVALLMVRGQRVR